MHVIAFEESMPDGADKTRCKNAKQMFSYLNLSLFYRQSSSLKALLERKNGRKQTCTLLIVTLDDVTAVIKQIYNILLFSIKPLGGLFISSTVEGLSEGGFRTMAYTRRLRLMRIPL